MAEPILFTDDYISVDITTGVRLLRAKKKFDPTGPYHDQSLRFAKKTFPQISMAKAWYNQHWKK